MRAAEVRVAGDLDLATAAVLADTLASAGAAAPLTLVLMEDVTFMDAAGLHVLLDAASAARLAGRKLVVARLRLQVAELLDLLDVRDEFDLVAAEPSAFARDDRPSGPASQAPPRNPVNAAIVAARAMAVPDDRLWLQTEDGVVRRAWAPSPIGDLASTGRPIELYVDHRGAVNGWRDVVSGLAVNQRQLGIGGLPRAGVPMVCQGRCQMTWQAPAAARLIEHGERCLTCAGPLAPG